jgi:transcriptional regulator with XRE-family HTH domain
MNNYGTIIRSIREEKGLSQKYIYEGIVSRQAYYLIESNLSIPSLDNFLKILERLNISFNDFLYLLNSEHFPSDKELYDKLILLKAKNDSQSFKTFIQQMENSFLDTSNEKYRHFSCIAKATFLYLFPSDSDKNNHELEHFIEPIKNYLLEIETWYLYELRLLHLSLFGFSLKNLEVLENLLTARSFNYCNFLEFTTIQKKIRQDFYQRMQLSMT